MYVTRVKITNVLGIEHLDFEPGKITEISGPNGSGKTSVLETIQAVLKGGNDATLLRKGAAKGEAVLVLDDGTEITRAITATTSTTTVRDAEGKKQARPSDILRNLTDLYSANPVEFLRAPKKDRVRVLLETMPLKVDAAAIEEITGEPCSATENAHAVVVINGLHKGYYDERTGVNRVIDEKKKSIKQLKEAVPEAPAGVEGSEDEIRIAIKTADDARDAEEKRISEKLSTIKTQMAEEAGKIDTALAEAIAKLQQEAEANKQALRDKLAGIQVAAEKQRTKNITTHSETTAPLIAALNLIVANRDAHAKREQTLKNITQLETDLEKFQDDALRLDKIMAGLEAYKATLLASLPIPGLEVRAGEIFRDDVAFDRLNTAQQVSIAVEIAKLRTGELGCCCVDGLELLDPAAYEAFKAQAVESGLQMFISKVTGEDFTINPQGTVA
jgi:recombinational DNA repair ATPase RecF